MYSDNGTNFVGASRELREVYETTETLEVMAYHLVGPFERQKEDMHGYKIAVPNWTGLPLQVLINQGSQYGIFSYGLLCKFGNREISDCL